MASSDIVVNVYPRQAVATGGGLTFTAVAVAGPGGCMRREDDGTWVRLEDEASPAVASPAKPGPGPALKWKRVEPPDAFPVGTAVECKHGGAWHLGVVHTRDDGHTVVECADGRYVVALRYEPDGHWLRVAAPAVVAPAAQQRCPRCGGPAYVGLFSVECEGRCT